MKGLVGKFNYFPRKKRVFIHSVCPFFQIWTIAEEKSYWDLIGIPEKVLKMLHFIFIKNFKNADGTFIGQIYRKCLLFSNFQILVRKTVIGKFHFIFQNIFTSADGIFVSSK